MPLITLTSAGLYCEAGDFHIDPWRPVARAVITHAHGDHASWGHEHYLVSRAGEHVTRRRLPEASIQTVAYYKLQPDPTCAPFEPVRCDAFITESTFGLPIYRWRDPREVFAEVNAWWRANQAVDRASVVYAYALGKAQRLLMSIDPAIGPIYTHGAVEGLNEAYRASGIALPATQRVSELPRGHDFSRALIVAPPSAQSTPWLRRFGDYADAFASGWMQIRGVRRRRAIDRGFTLSDHADWPSLLEAVAATGAHRVYVTHGYSEPLVRWLTEHWLDAQTLKTEFAGEEGSAADAAAEPAQ